MNYFSHFYVLPNYVDDYLTLGSILPDMLRNAKSDFGNLKAAQGIGIDQSLTEGVLNHIHVDQRFHNSDFFYKTTREMSAYIRDMREISMNRYTQFYAHILLELLIDHELIKENLELIDSFYDSLNGVDFDEIERYFQVHLPSQDAELFWQKFEKFKQRQFLRDYIDLDKVIHFSFYIYEKATKKEVNREELIQYKSIIKRDFLPNIQEKNRNLFNWLRQAT